MAGEDAILNPPQARARAWFHDGLHFSCRGCGGCCGHEPGYVWLCERELREQAEHLGMAAAEFRRRFTRLVPGRGLSLIERSDNWCVFYQEGRGCTVYPVRPRQCRTWPFWEENLRSVEDWRACGARCPGVDSGLPHAEYEIRRMALADGLPRPRHVRGDGCRP